MVVVTVLTSLLLALVPATVASAATVYEITGRWTDGTPSAVTSGDVVNAEWRVNINDDAAAASNDPVDNVTFSVTLTSGVFAEVPAACSTSGVTPASSISADGTVLTCNLGTQTQGTAVVVQTPVVADGSTGDQLGAVGSIDGKTAALPGIEITGRFGMNMRWGTPTNYMAPGSGYRDLDFQWTLSLDRGSEAGPQSVSYDLTLSSAQATGWLAAPQECSPFTDLPANGHPWSGGSHPSQQMARFVDSCTLTQTGANTFRLTLSGIDYSEVGTPTQDSAGSRLPVDQTAIASGSVWIRLLTPELAGSVQLAASAPTYTSASGVMTEVDEASDNTSSKSWTSPGTYSSAWVRPYTGNGGTPWDTTYRVAPGTELRQWMDTAMQLHVDRADDHLVGMCTAVDSRYAYLSGVGPFTQGAGDKVISIPEAEISYYTGNDPLLDPNDEDTYNPNAFVCGGTAGWSTTPPADLADVKAVRVTMSQGDAEKHSSIPSITFNVYQTIKPDVPAGTDVWAFFSSVHDAPRDNWLNDSGCAAPTPGLRYECTTGWRDLVRVTTASPSVQKSVDRSVVTAGVPAVYTLTYSANGDGRIPDTVDGFQLVDTLPAGVTYVSGSATPEPTVTTGSDGRQTLTWVLDDVATNVDQALTYRAVSDDSVEPGTTLENTVVASYDGAESRPATAQVTTTTDGFTTIGKVADTPFIPNVAGDGVGTGSWTVTLRSYDPVAQAFTDTIDVLPYVGDGRGTSYSGTYTLTGVSAVNGATVYYTDADPATLSDDPADAMNGAAGDITGNTVGWSTIRPTAPTAVRVIGPVLPASGTQQFTVEIATDGAEGGDLLVNRAQARAEHTELVMRTSAPVTVANYYSAAIKKYVKGNDGEWHDANDVTDYPTYRVGDRVPYRIVIENTGQGTLRDLEITDDLFPDGSFTVDELAPGAQQAHEFTVTLTGGGTMVNTACGSGAVPDDSGIAPTINCDPAGVEVVNYTTVKSSDPASGATVKPGDTIEYTVTVTQQGDVPAIAEFTDTLAEVLDDADYNGDVSASIGTATVTGDVLSWNGTVPVGETATITYSVTVKDSAALAADGDYRVANQVMSPGCVDAGDCATEHTVADYTVVKSSDPADGSNVAEGDTIEYTLTVSQIGEGAYAGASLIDDLSDVLDDATWNGDLVASSGTAGFAPATATLSWSGDLAIGQVVTITYSVTVTGAGDTHLHNVVTSDGCSSQESCETEHVTATYTTVKTSDPASGTDVAIGDVITYTVTVTQSGEGRVVGLANVLDDATYNGDLAADHGTATYDAATGVISWTGDLGPGDVAKVTYSVTVTADGDTLIGNTVRSPGCETASDCETEHKTGRYQTVKTSEPASGTDVQVGDVIEYTVAVSQIGEASVAGASFTDDLSAVLDDATWNGDLVSSAGTVSYTEPTLSWSGDLAVGDVVTVTYSVTVTGAGDMTLRNVVTSDGCVDEGSCTTTHQTGDYTVSKTSVAAPGSAVAIGDTITYTVTVAQRGPGAVEGATFVDDLTAVLDDATWNDDVTASQGTASFDAASGHLTWTGDLAAGDVVTVTYSVAVTGAGDLSLTNVVVPGENGECVPAGDQNPDCTTTHETGRFTYSKMADPAHNTDVRPGDVVTYTVTVTQVGPAAVEASLVDDLSDVLDDADYNGDVAASAGAATVDGTNLSWNSTLAPGDVVTITYSVTVTGAGNTTLANVVSSPSPAGECVAAPDGTEDCRTIHKTGGYVYAKTADPASGAEVTRGDRVTYTVTITQRGEGAVADAIVVDDLSDVLDDATWNDDAKATSGSVARAGDTLTWEGDLAPGQTATVTYSVTVNADGPAQLRNIVTSPDPRAICDPAGACETEHTVHRTPPLAVTGVVLGGGLGVLALGLLIAGATLMVIRRRREEDVVTS